MQIRSAGPLLTANNPDELQQKLAAMPTDVPLRSEGRKSRHVEIYAITHLLATLSPDYWKFPIELIHRDRPDFLLRTRGRDIGIEHVEVVPRNEAHMARLREEGHGPDVHFVRHGALDEPKLTRKQALKEIEDDDPGDGWVGDSPEREWAEAMARAAENKVAVAGKPGYEAFDETWLLMYDGWPVPNNDPRTSATYLLAQSGMPAILRTFARVFIMDGRGSGSSLAPPPSTCCAIREIGNFGHVASEPRRPGQRRITLDLPGLRNLREQVAGLSRSAEQLRYPKPQYLQTPGASRRAAAPIWF